MALAAYPHQLFSHSREQQDTPSRKNRSGRIEVYMAFQPARFIPETGPPASACALTTRFHPYHAVQRDGIVSVTLSVPAIAGPIGQMVRHSTLSGLSSLFRER